MLIFRQDYAMAGNIAVALIVEMLAGGKAPIVSMTPPRARPFHTLPTTLSVCAPVILGWGETDPGPTFGVAVVAVALAIVDAGLLFAYVRYAGDGPIYKRMSVNNANLATANRNAYNAAVAAQGERRQ